MSKLVYVGNLGKMNASLVGENVVYSLENKQGEILHLNELIGKNIEIKHSGKNVCHHCDTEVSELKRQGYCVTCYYKLAECDKCIMSPELCHYDQGTCRDPKWGEANCLKPHAVYLSYTSSYKVGITRHANMPTRWLDQGATKAAVLFNVSKRHVSGLVEVAFKDFISDRTNFRNMLLDTDSVSDEDFIAKAKDVLEKVNPSIERLRDELGADEIIPAPEITPQSFNYPLDGSVLPEKVGRGVSFKDAPLTISGVLRGIKGQYCYIGDKWVNIRSQAGKHVEIYTD
jgi:hypothetical protein